MDPLFNGIFIHMQEMRIHLQHVNIQFEKHVQGRIPAAEIVHQHHETVIAEFPHHSLHFFRIVRTGGFGYFNLQCLFGKLVLLYKELNILGYIKRKDIDCRHIHRNGNQRQAPCFTALQPAAHFFPDKLIQVRDETVFFQYGNEHKRRNHRTVRFYPPGQCFSAHNTGC